MQQLRPGRLTGRGSPPAATEVAAYRIIIEALTNVVRHAEATCAVVELAIAEHALALSVRADGRTRGDWTPGVGIASMRERSQQVGGTVTATALADGGLVRTRIPLLVVEEAVSAGSSPTP